MAHYARIDGGIVREVVRVENTVLDPDGTGIEDEALGAKFLSDLLGGTWVQTSYAATFRGKYAGIGDSYDQAAKVFASPVKADADPVAVKR